VPYDTEQNGPAENAEEVEEGEDAEDQVSIECSEKRRFGAISVQSPTLDCIAAEYSRILGARKNPETWKKASMISGKRNHKKLNTLVGAIWENIEMERMEMRHACITELILGGADTFGRSLRIFSGAQRRRCS
jgi:hypothetical protein